MSIVVRADPNDARTAGARAATELPIRRAHPARKYLIVIQPEAAAIGPVQVLKADIPGKARDFVERF